MNFDEAMRDIREYLEAQEDEYFEEKGTTREAVMADTDRLAWCAREHKKCVEAYGVDREFSCKDACDKAPGAVPPAVKKSVLCRCKRAGSETDTAVPFEELKAGDTVYVRGIPHELAEDAHFSGDADYEGYLAYGVYSDGIFPEDVDQAEN